VIRLDDIRVTAAATRVKVIVYNHDSDLLGVAIVAIKSPAHLISVRRGSGP